MSAADRVCTACGTRFRFREPGCLALLGCLPLGVVCLALFAFAVALILAANYLAAIVATFFATSVMGVGAKLTATRTGCPACRGGQSIPADSPVGRRITGAGK